MVLDIDSPYPLDREQLDQFRRDGFVRLKRVFDAATLLHYGDAITRETIAHNTQTVPLEERSTYDKAFLQVMNLWCHGGPSREFVLRGDQRLPCPDDGHVLCILREFEGERTLLLANLSDTPAAPQLEARLPFAGWLDLMSRARGDADRETTEPTQPLGPYGVRLLGQGNAAVE